jgi:hypothetical protein
MSRVIRLLFGTPAKREWVSEQRPEKLKREKKYFTHSTTDERFQKMAGVGVEPRKKEIQPDDYFWRVFRSPSGMKWL